MPEISFTGVLPVAAIAFLMPLVLGLVPSLRLPSVVLEIVASIVIGPAFLGLVEVDLPLQVLALLGLAFLLFLAGLDIDFDHLRGALRRCHRRQRTRGRSQAKTANPDDRISAP